ncbi:hypothetical protein BRADI_2g04260v3 [Brachypodium distachyon]|uniref:Uncharacterized protein n=1 Tax=Brachypodium distachyon TaxID=15368 RepID=A0A2K2D6V6_BRADI|nr:hypothetical protein BRADI_2g04260v3 [Brachypodium distachyon]
MAGGEYFCRDRRRRLRLRHPVDPSFPVSRTKIPHRRRCDMIDGHAKRADLAAAPARIVPRPSRKTSRHGRAIRRI